VTQQVTVAWSVKSPLDPREAVIHAAGANRQVGIETGHTDLNRRNTASHIANVRLHGGVPSFNATEYGEREAIGFIGHV
jgi:hypothetical protein